MLWLVLMSIGVVATVQIKIHHKLPDMLHRETKMQLRSIKRAASTNTPVRIQGILSLHIHKHFHNKSRKLQGTKQEKSVC